MLQINIPCPHETGKIMSWKKSHPDYHPLTMDEIGKLLDIAREADTRTKKGKRLISTIQCRLARGIKGMTCPLPLHGKVSNLDAKLGELYVIWINSGRPKPKRALIKRLFNIMNWRDL